MTFPLVASLRGLFLVGTLRVLVSAERRDLPSFSAGTSMPSRPPPLAVPLVFLAFVGVWFGVVYIARVSARTDWMVACVGALEPSMDHDAAVQVCAVQQ